ncbi:hypothetical protein AAFF_G00436550 [Aldrovandia affinis]|uniref:Tudor domain-containing protein n=1 Tax=Aldrovandia affinis TaxID=143900 RepID=A0AAD7SA95_9TELE|nr:hypothetical protein AAFF_G00436550 [Aldrovandia affinis]
MNALQQGDLVNAEFEDDCSWYRAVVRDKIGNCTVHVEFIDFGNAATISSSKICRLDKQFLELPRYSIHCLLNGVSSMYKDKWDKEVVATFQRAVGENAEKKLKCNFIKQTGYIWEVSLADQNVMLADVLFASGPAVALDGFMSKNLQSPKLGNTVPEKSRNKSEMDITTLVYKTPYISEGQTFEMYATSIVGPDYFWCQYAQSDKLQEISELVGEMGNSAVQEATWVDALCPGSPCLALFKEDEQWYRAEVITKIENLFSVLFVDYGNESKVEQNTVKPVPPLLLETPPQATLCLLEGFDPSQGSWSESAADQFIGLVMDEVLRVTIVKVQNKKEKIPQYRVRVVCKEQVINDTMKGYWKHSTSLVGTELPKNEERPSTEVAVSFEISSLETNELISAGQNISTDLYPEENVEDTIYSLSNVPQSFGSQNKQSKSLNSGESIEISEQQPDLPVNILPVEKTGIKDEDFEFTSELVTGFECDILAEGDQGNDEGREIPRVKNEIEETQVVAENPTENTLSLSDYREDSDASFNLVGVRDSTSEISYPIGSSKAMLSCTLEVLEESTELVSEGTDIAEVASASSEELPGVNSVCLAMSEQEDCENKMRTSESFKDSEETDKNITPFDSRSTSTEVQACTLDETDPLFYKVDESFDELLVLHEDQCPDAHTDSDIYEEVFKQCTGPNLKDVRPVPLFSDEIFRKENVEEDHMSKPESEFDKLELAEGKRCVGSDCAVWSYAHSSWCRGRIVTISEDCATVLLLEYNEETTIDLQNSFERHPEKPVQDPVADTFSSNSGSQPVCDNKPEERPERGAVLPPENDSEVAQGEIMKAAASVTDVETCDQDNRTDEKTEDGVDISPVSASEEMVHGEMQASTCASAGNVFEEQTSHVTHLTLKVEELSDDEVIFVRETQIPRQQVQELGTNEKEQPKDLN